MGQKHSTMPSPPPVDNKAVYRSLPVDEKSIRLVRILSDGQLELKVFPMEPFNSTGSNSGTPTYYALSYCWFNSPQDALWQCNGLDFLTTRTLDDFFCQYLGAVKNRRSKAKVERFAPERLRDPAHMTFAHADHTAKDESNRYPWYWIDQICINQNDEAEKIIQIGLMTAIYTRSQETIVWLGSGNKKDTEKLAWLALDPRGLPSSYTIGEFALSSRTQEMALLRAGVVNFTRRGDNELKIIADRIRLDEEHARLLIPAYEKILSLPWFSRTWVIQEVALSPKKPLAIYGNLMLSWTKILGVITFSRQPTWYSNSLVQEVRGHESGRTPDPKLWQGVRMQLAKFPQAAVNLRILALMSNLNILTSGENSGVVADGVELESLLLLAPCLEATIFHDRVNGMLGLAKEARPKKTSKFDEITGQTSTVEEPISSILQVTYNKPFLDWTRDLTRYVIDTNRSLRIWWILRNRPRVKGLPSWVVDLADASPNLLFFGDFRKWGGDDPAQFSATSYYRNTASFLPDPYLGDTGGSSVALPSDVSRRKPVTEPHPNPNILSVKGYKIDTIQQVGPTLDALDPRNLARTWMMYISAFEHDDVHNTMPSLALQFLWAGLMDGPSTLGFSKSFIGFQTPSSASAIFSDGKTLGALKGFFLGLDPALSAIGESQNGRVIQRLRDFIYAPHPFYDRVGAWDPNYEKFTRHIVRITKRVPMVAGHSLFWTIHNRHVGQCSDSARPGDIICRIYGGESPMILRPTGSPQHYQLVGPCYIAHEEWLRRRVTDTDEQSRRYPKYKDLDDTAEIFHLV